MPPFGGTAAGREQYGVKISKMCGKDVLSYGKDVFLFVRKQAKTRQAGKQSAGTRGKRKQNFRGRRKSTSELMCIKHEPSVRRCGATARRDGVQSLCAASRAKKGAHVRSCGQVRELLAV